MNLRAATALWLLTACRTAPFDAPPDLATACRPPCAAGAICVHPCSDLIGCAPTIDGGCPPYDVLVADCANGGGAGCVLDFTPRCVADPAPFEHCPQRGADIVCTCP